MATHEEALTAKKALNGEAFNGRVLTVKWCAVALGYDSIQSALACSVVGGTPSGFASWYNVFLDSGRVS